MSKRWLWLMILGLALLLIAAPLSLGQAGKAEKKEPVPGEKSDGLVGTILHVTPASRTLVVDVPLGKDVPRIGATVTDQTKVEAAGKAASVDRLTPGARVRIKFRRVATGDEAISVEVLRNPGS